MVLPVSTRLSLPWQGWHVGWPPPWHWGQARRGRFLLLAACLAVLWSRARSVGPMAPAREHVCG